MSGVERLLVFQSFSRARRRDNDDGDEKKEEGPLLSPSRSSRLTSRGHLSLSPAPPPRHPSPLLSLVRSLRLFFRCVAESFLPLGLLALYRFFFRPRLRCYSFTAAFFFSPPLRSISRPFAALSLSLSDALWKSQSGEKVRTVTGIGSGFFLMKRRLNSIAYNVSEYIVISTKRCMHTCIELLRKQSLFESRGINHIGCNSARKRVSVRCCFERGITIHLEKRMFSRERSVYTRKDSKIS